MVGACVDFEEHQPAWLPYYMAATTLPLRQRSGLSMPRILHCRQCMLMLLLLLSCDKMQLSDATSHVHSFAAPLPPGTYTFSPLSSIAPPRCRLLYSERA